MPRSSGTIYKYRYVNIDASYVDHMCIQWSIWQNAHRIYNSYCAIFSHDNYSPTVLLHSNRTTESTDQFFADPLKVIQLVCDIVRLEVNWAAEVMWLYSRSDMLTELPIEVQHTGWLGQIQPNVVPIIKVLHVPITTNLHCLHVLRR